MSRSESRNALFGFFSQSNNNLPIETAHDGGSGSGAAARGRGLTLRFFACKT